MSTLSIIPSREHLGNRIRDARLTKGISQYQMGELILNRQGKSVGQATVSNWEMGKYEVYAYALFQVSTLLGVSLDYFNLSL